jgi:hypothetical protein
MPPLTALFAPAAPPAAWNRPFQFAAGSQTSIWMSESVAGLTLATTRQKDGNVVNGLPPRPPRPPPASEFTGGVNAPTATTSAREIVVSGNFNTASDWHEPVSARTAVSEIGVSATAPIATLALTIKR